MAKRSDSGRAASKPRSLWLTHYQQWLQSGLSKAAYCRDNGLSAATFYNWCHRFANADELVAVHAPKPEPLQLMPVSIQNDAHHPDSVERYDNSTKVIITCAALTVQLPARLPPEQIDHWLATLAGLYV